MEANGTTDIEPDSQIRVADAALGGGRRIHALGGRCGAPCAEGPDGRPHEDRGGGQHLAGAFGVGGDGPRLDFGQRDSCDRHTSVHPSGMIGPRGIVPKETGTENGEKAGCDKKAALTAQKFGE